MLFPLLVVAQKTPYMPINSELRKFGWSMLVEKQKKKGMGGTKDFISEPGRKIDLIKREKGKVIMAN